MGLFGMIGRRLYDVGMLAKATIGLASTIGKKLVEGGRFVGKAIKFVFGKKAPMVPVRETLVELGTATRNARIPVARVIPEVKGVIPPAAAGIPSYSGFGASNSAIPFRSVPRVTISSPPSIVAPVTRVQPLTNLNAFPVTPSTAGFKDFSRAGTATIEQLSKDVYTAGSRGQLRNIIQDKGYFYGNPKRAELLRGVLTPATDISKARSLPLGMVSARAIGNSSKVQRVSNVINTLGEIGRGRELANILL